MKKNLLSITAAVAAILFSTPLAYGQVYVNQLAHREAFPQVAFGAGWSTNFTATNVSTQPRQVTFGFGNQDGTNCVVSVYKSNDLSQPYVVAAGFNSLDIAPKATVSYTIISNTTALTACSMSAVFDIEIDSNGVIKDTIQTQTTYTLTLNGVVVGTAAVFPVTPSTTAGFQAVRMNQADSGVAISNFNDTAAGVTLTIHNMAGGVFSTVSLVIPAFGQIAQFITQLAPELQTGWSGGLVEVAADKEVGVESLTMIGGTFSAGTTF